MTKPTWIMPSFEKERGEIERVAQHFGKGADFVQSFLQSEATTSLTPLTEDIWNLLENTDSGSLKVGEWEKVEALARDTKRDWVTLKKKMVESSEMDAPIIFKNDGTYHLVSGNTRLMVAKALGVTPQVVIRN